ncbi:MAG: hypothetical protein ACE5GS_16060 [Kiloniellaceae bacterium]
MFDRDHVRLKEALSEPAANAGAAYLDEVLGARISSPPADLHHAFSENQIASKKWLLDTLHETLGGRYGTVYILGGWYGVLGAMLLGDPRYDVELVLSFDIEPHCAPVAERINETHLRRSRFRAVTADVRGIDYADLDGGRAACRPTRGEWRRSDLVVNTSCEHMPRTADWYDRIPAGMLQVYQSNDNFACPEHVNCVADLQEFTGQLPMSELYYEGALKRRRYSRFMLIGRK